MFLFFEGFQPENIILFFISLKHSYLFIVKLISDVNNFL